LIAGACAGGGDGSRRKDENAGSGAARGGDSKHGEGLDRLNYDTFAVKVDQIEGYADAGRRDAAERHKPESFTLIGGEGLEPLFETGLGKVGGLHVGTEESLAGLVVNTTLA